MKHIIAPLLFFIISLTLNAEDSNNILILSIAKSGTHLAGKLVSLITGKIHKSPSTIERLKIRSSLTAVIHLNRKSHMFSHLHTAYSETTEALLKKMNIRTIFIYRDPRDQILSWIGHDQENIEQRVRQAILPDFEYIAAEKGVTNYYNARIPWIYQDSVCSIRFEDVIGSAGGGSDIAQFNTIQRVANYLGYTLTTQEIEAIIEQLFGGTNTFREGKIGAWKNHFSNKNKDLFKQYAGKLLIDLGYETDYAWY